MAELDYNKDQEITFREFIFGIASWVGFNDPGDDELDAEEELNPVQSDDNDEENIDTVENGASEASPNSMNSNNNNNNNNNNNTNNRINRTSSSNNVKKSESNVGKGAALVNNYSQDIQGNQSEKEKLVRGKVNAENETTETEDASFLTTKDKLEKTYLVTSSKQDGVENSQDKNSVEKSASNEISAPPAGYTD